MQEIKENWIQIQRKSIDIISHEEDITRELTNHRKF